jgi:lantibiotic transport system permease protein
MAFTFLHSFRSEWLKTKRSTATWLTIIGGFFTSLIYLFAYLSNHSAIVANLRPDEKIWKTHFFRLWQTMAFFLLPMGVILASSLITQIEFKNNTWKQLHTTPQSLTTIFFSKISVILLMMLQFFILFNLGILLSGLITGLFYSDIPFLKQQIPFLFFLKVNIKFFICCLPIIAFQYLISLQFKNFLVAVGTGLVILMSSLIGLNWKYVYILPYSYCGLNFNSVASNTPPKHSIYLYSIEFFLLFMLISYILYLTKKEKG